MKACARLLALAPLACGDAAIEPAELAEVCGAAGPFRVLELPPDQQLMSQAPLHIGDRVLYLVSALAPDSAKGAVELTLGDSSETKRVFSVPDLANLDLPGLTWLHARIDDGRWLVSTGWTNNTHDLLDLRTGATERLAAQPSSLIGVLADSIDLLRVPPCCFESDFRDEGPVWRVPFSGAPAQQIAARATDRAQPLADGRLLTPLNLDSQWLGDLVLVEPETRAERLVDGDVFINSIGVGWRDDADVIRYSVRDGARSGVYLARLPARAAPHPRAHSQPREAFTHDLLPGPDGAPFPWPRRVGDPAPLLSPMSRAFTRPEPIR